MKIPIIMWIFLAMIIVIVAGFLFRPFDERRKGDAPATPAVAPRKRFKPNWLIIILVCLIIGGIWVARSHLPSVYPVAKDAQDVWVHIGEPVKVKIYPDRWSGWINVPPGARCMIDTPGEFEYLFWTGERIVVHEKETKWLGDIKSYSFRLRGSGEATITVQ
jgi:heme/copper-type cytochrome/quinol oxidase subunit 2